MVKQKMFASEDPEWDFASESDLIEDALKKLNKWRKPNIRIVSIETQKEERSYATVFPFIRVFYEEVK